MIRTDRPADTVARLVDRSLVLADADARRRAVRGAGDRPQLRPRAAAGHRPARRGATPPRRVVRRRDRRDRRRSCARPTSRRRSSASATSSTSCAPRCAGRSTTTSTWPPSSPTTPTPPVASCCGPRSSRGPPTSPSGCRPITRATGACRGALAGGLSMAGRLDDAVRIGADVLEHAPDTPRRSVRPRGPRRHRALRGPARRVGAHGRGPPASSARRLGDDALRRLRDRIGVAIGDAYGGDPDGALAMVADGPTCPAPSLAAWFEYVRGEAILDRDPATALAHLERADGDRPRGRRPLPDRGGVAVVVVAAGAQRRAAGRRRAVRPPCSTTSASAAIPATS